MWDTALLWELAKNIGAGGLRRMHAENIKYMRQLLRKNRASAANGRHTAGSGGGKRRSMQ
jgi:hypothetical protein